ncbi:MAG: response regulator [Acidobacteriota bacterium]|nr:response regulator [Acidobacteriota bacterium]
MAVITIDGATFCHGPEVTERVAEKLQLSRLSDEKVFSAATDLSGIAADKLSRMVYGPSSFFPSGTRDTVTAVAALRVAIVEAISPDNLVYHGLLGHLLSTGLTHVLRVCLAGTHDFRLAEAGKLGVGNRDARRRIKVDDEARADWMDLVVGLGAWDKSMYDIFIAMQETSLDDAVDLICDHARRPVLTLTGGSERALADVRRAAAVNFELAREGHDVDVVCDAARATVLIKKYSIFRDRQNRELEKIAFGIEGVSSVEVRPGPRFKEPDISFKIDLEVPSKVLLVDDEQEFVNTLSERLETRKMTPAVAYNGEEALAMVADDQPEVMVLDLKMPGIDGIEVLRRMKKTHPETEVIILTGHGSATEEELAAELGAFAYLRKPVDIEVLTETMQAAYRKIETTRGEQTDD